VDTSAPVRDEPLAIELMNTIWADRTGTHDALATAELARGWLTAHADRLDSVTLPQLGPLRQLRDAARTLGSGTPTGRAAALRLVNSSVRARWTELRWDGALVAAPRAAGTSGSHLVSTFAEAIVEAFTSDYEVRACAAPGCVLFYARVRDRREWCSAACGNRARVARHYDKHRKSAHH